MQKYMLIYILQFIFGGGSNLKNLYSKYIVAFSVLTIFITTAKYWFDKSGKGSTTVRLHPEMKDRAGEWVWTWIGVYNMSELSGLFNTQINKEICRTEKSMNFGSEPDHCNCTEISRSSVPVSMLIANCIICSLRFVVWFLPLETLKPACEPQRPLHCHKVNYSPLCVIINNCQPEGVTHDNSLKRTQGEASRPQLGAL